jgi:hypothetical protein
MTIRVRRIVVVGEGGGTTVEGGGLLFCARGTSDVAAQEKLVRGRAGPRHEIEGNVVETLAGAKSAAARQLGRPGGAAVVGPAESSKTRRAITNRRAGRDIGWFAAGHINFCHARARVGPKLSSAIRGRGRSGNERLGEGRRRRHRIRGPINSAVARQVNAIEPGYERVPGRILRIEHHVVHAAIDRAGKIETKTLARINRAHRETRSRDSRRRPGHIRQSRQAAHRLRRNVATERRIRSQADDAAGGADKKCVGIARHAQNLADGTAREEPRAPWSDAVGVDVVPDGIDGADQSCRRIDVFDPVEAYARITVRRTIRFACANPEPPVDGIQVERSDGQSLRGIEDCRPGNAAIERAIDAALSRADINLIGIGRIDFDRRNSAAHGHTGGLRLAQRNRIRSQFNPVWQNQRRLCATGFFHRPGQSSDLIVHESVGPGSRLRIEWLARVHATQQSHKSISLPPIFSLIERTFHTRRPIGVNAFVLVQARIDQRGEAPDQQKRRQ